MVSAAEVIFEMKILHTKIGGQNVRLCIFSRTKARLFTR
jgi:hypothetical protein